MSSQYAVNFLSHSLIYFVWYCTKCEIEAPPFFVFLVFAFWNLIFVSKNDLFFVLSVQAICYEQPQHYAVFKFAITIFFKNSPHIFPYFSIQLSSPPYSLPTPLTPPPLPPSFANNKQTKQNKKTKTKNQNLQTISFSFFSFSLVWFHCSSLGYC